MPSHAQWAGICNVFGTPGLTPQDPLRLASPVLHPPNNKKLAMTNESLRSNKFSHEVLHQQIKKTLRTQGTHLETQEDPAISSARDPQDPSAYPYFEKMTVEPPSRPTKHPISQTSKRLWETSAGLDPRAKASAKSLSGLKVQRLLR